MYSYYFRDPVIYHKLPLHSCAIQYLVVVSSVCIVLELSAVAVSILMILSSPGAFVHECMVI